MINHDDAGADSRSFYDWLNRRHFYEYQQWNRLQWFEGVNPVLFGKAPMLLSETPMDWGEAGVILGGLAQEMGVLPDDPRLVLNPHFLEPRKACFGLDIKLAEELGLRLGGKRVRPAVSFCSMTQKGADCRWHNDSSCPRDHFQFPTDHALVLFNLKDKLERHKTVPFHEDTDRMERGRHVIFPGLPDGIISRFKKLTAPEGVLAAWDGPWLHPLEAMIDPDRRRIRDFRSLMLTEEKATQLRSLRFEDAAVLA